MENIFLETSLLWSQIDANSHLRHSAYADLAAQARINMLNSIDLTSEIFQELRIGPILFREELVYLKEVRANDRISVSCCISRYRRQGSRYSLEQEMFLENGIKAATIYVDGAWLHVDSRKLASLPATLNERFLTLPKSSRYVLLPDPE